MATGAPAPAKQATPAPNFYLDGKPSPAKRRTPAPAPAKRKAAAAPQRQSAKPRTTAAKSAQAAQTASPRPKRTSFPLDPYRLTTHFARRWDLLNVLVDEAGRRAYVEEALEARTRVLEESLDTLHSQIEKHRLDVRHKVLALYLLERAQDSPMYAPNDIAASHAAAMRFLLRRDARRVSETMAQYEPLRRDLNASLERLGTVRSGKTPPPAVEEPPAWRYGVTVAVGEYVAWCNRALVAERTVPADTAAAMEAVAWLARQKPADTLSSLRPAPPNALMPYRPLVPLDTPPPEEPAPVRKYAPDDPKLRPPARSNSLRIEAPPGSPVKAAAAGRVVFAGPLVSHANVVVVEHAKGLQSVYALLSDASVRAGQEIEAGAAVGTAAPLPGGKSSRVLFQVRRGGKLLPASELLGARDPAECIR